MDREQSEPTAHDQAPGTARAAARRARMRGSPQADLVHESMKTAHGSHFKNTLFRRIHSQALTILMFSELVAASLCAYGCLYSIIYNDTDFILYGLVITSFVLLSLLLGQRIAKDYVGAADITIYFILCIITMMSF